MVKVVRKTTKGDITKTILLSIQTAGVLSAALVAPNVLTAMSKLGILPNSKYPNGIINRARDILLQKGFLKKDSDGFLELTEEGSKRLESYLCDGYELVVPRIWDKKWRIIIFDIPERKRFLRDKLRASLVSIGFVRLQGSVWAFPYDCSEFISLLKADLKIGKDILYMVVEHLENDTALRDGFGLK